MDLSAEIQIVNFLFLASIVIGYPALTIAAIITLKKRKFSGLSVALWVLIACIVPYLGALSVWIFKPYKYRRSKSR